MILSRKNLTFNEVKKYIEYDIKDWKRLLLLSKEYINARTKLIIQDEDGYLYNLSFDTIKQNYKKKQNFCKFNTNNKFTIFNIRMWLNINNINYKLLSDTYIKKKCKLLWKCEKGHIFEMTFDNFYNGKRCDICSFNNMAFNMTKTQSEFENEIYNLVGNEYSVLGIYTKSSNKILMQHNICGYKWSPFASNFIKGSRCPQCLSSKGEDKIKEICLNWNIPYDKQYTFDDLRGIGGGLLKFDVPVFWDVEKTNLRMLIEFDGEQHFRAIGFGTNKEKALKQLKYIQYHDKLKNEYCNKHNIKLLRIKWDDYDNIEKILSQELNDLIVKVS